MRQPTDDAAYWAARQRHWARILKEAKTPEMRKRAEIWHENATDRLREINRARVEEREKRR